MPALRALCGDRDLDWYIRTNAVDAVLAAARQQGGEALDYALAWAASIASDEQEDWDMRLCVGNTLLDFPRARVPSIDRCWKNWRNGNPDGACIFPLRM